MAILLAKAGRRVTLLEKTPAIGGRLVRFRRQGIPFDTGLHFTSSLVGILGQMLTALDSIDNIDGVLYLNPGSVSEPRRGSEPSLMTIVVEEREVFDVQRIILTPFGPMSEGDYGKKSANHWDDFDDFDADEMKDHTHIDFSEIGF